MSIPEQEPCKLGSALPPTARNDWSVYLVALDKASKLGDLIRDMHRDPSETGEGKQIASGFAYWGVGPTLAWLNACNDFGYPVMRRSIETFNSRWHTVHAAIAGKGFHYVSLGIGNGEKDYTILEDLARATPDLVYIAVDMSSEMLRLGIRRPITDLKMHYATQVVPIQLDFSEAARLVELRAYLDRIVGDEPILFSLLGNTLANFDQDIELLAMLTGQLLRPQDRFLLEVATTSDLNLSHAENAAAEYRGTRAFREWVTSAILHYTDLSLDPDSVSYRGTIEANRALRVNIQYSNHTGANLRLMLPDQSSVPFPQGDTVRLDLTRKYLVTALDSLCAPAHVSIAERSHENIGLAPGRLGGNPGQFGIDLLLLQPGDQQAPDDLWDTPPRR